uniref:Uncharacterized protein n=1 Tax=Hyaloperonospora arabidopsidis (strain Emoy2) TaxID=559515 RepID=M4C390_HYAAE
MESLGYKAKPTLTAEDFKVPPSAHVTTTKHNIKTDSHKENLEPYTLDGTVHYDTVAAPVGDLSSQAKAEAAVVYNGIMKAASSAIAAVSGAAAKKYDAESSNCFPGCIPKSASLSDSSHGRSYFCLGACQLRQSP